MRKEKLPNMGLPPSRDMSEGQARRTFAEVADLSGSMPELDLHGQTAAEASVNVYSFITNQAASGEVCCRITHGKGTGVLQQVVAKEVRELQEQGTVETSFQSQKYPGAAVVVIFPI